MLYIYKIGISARVQTAYRLDAGLLERLKWKARRTHQSLNSYVEDVLEREALKDPGDDLEDNAQIAFAYSQCCDGLLTYDKKLLSRELPRPMKVMTPEEFVNHCRA